MKVSNLELPDARIKFLERLLRQTINDFKKQQSINFSERLQAIISRYNERSEQNILDYDGI